MMNSSMRRWSLGGTHSSALNSPKVRSPRGACPATRDGRSETSKDWIAPIPDSPATRRPHTRSSPMPSGVTSPMPVTTTRLMRPSCPGSCYENSGGKVPSPEPTDPARWCVNTRSAVRLDEADRVLDGNDLFGRVIRDFAPEFLFEGHHQLDRIKAVGAQIVDETGILGHLGFVDAEMLDDDLRDPLGDVAHSIISSI